MTLEKICEALSQHRFDLSTEKDTQAAIEKALIEAGISFEREKAILLQRKIDFLCEGGIGIEVKLTGNAKKIYRQVEAYCQSPLVSALILATARTIGFPKEISGKPCKVMTLTRGWL